MEFSIAMIVVWVKYIINVAEINCYVKYDDDSGCVVMELQ